ncbi:uncharacterized protein RAG0_00716 [Rhynchosporium agropyri]|uniref:Uncharacterized protein n=1 Tax=Rhynchosporium agropyri TaxID=914238 RepID=A0A1E1JYG9_9HELO|nr:uncharacterized protein RAG0_00716 [Rhynchosporium agropyri]
MCAILVTIAIYRTPIKKNRKNRDTYYYPSETESGSYCTGISWETGDAITCWKNARSFVVRTPERKSSDDGTHQIATNGVPSRTPVRIPGKERDMLRVSFLMYKPSEGEEIILLSQGVDSLDAAAFSEKTEKLDTCSR